MRRWNGLLLGCVRGVISLFSTTAWSAPFAYVSDMNNQGYVSVIDLATEMEVAAR